MNNKDKNEIPLTVKIKAVVLPIVFLLMAIAWGWIVINKKQLPLFLFVVWCLIMAIAAIGIYVKIGEYYGVPTRNKLFQRIYKLFR